MLDRNQIASASQTLHDHWRAGTKFDALDDWCRPSDRTEGYAIQAAIERFSTTHLFGWKIAATSEAGQKHINVAGPLAGHIFAERVILAIQRLKDFPESGRMIPEVENQALREIIVQGYRVMYRMEADHVLILAVMHGSRDLRIKG